MSGATFHPVVIGEEPSTSASYDFVALKSDVEDIKVMLDDVQSKLNSHTHLHNPGTITPAIATATALPQSTTSYTVQGSSKTKVET